METDATDDPDPDEQPGERGEQPLDGQPRERSVDEQPGECPQQRGGECVRVVLRLEGEFRADGDGEPSDEEADDEHDRGRLEPVSTHTGWGTPARVSLVAPPRTG